MAAPEAAGELAGMERVNDSPRPATTADTAPKRDPTHVSHEQDSVGGGPYVNDVYTKIGNCVTLPHSNSILSPSFFVSLFDSP